MAILTAWQAEYDGINHVCKNSVRFYKDCDNKRMLCDSMAHGFLFYAHAKMKKDFRSYAEKYPLEHYEENLRELEPPPQCHGKKAIHKKCVIKTVVKPRFIAMLDKIMDSPLTLELKDFTTLRTVADTAMGDTVMGDTR